MIRFRCFAVTAALTFAYSLAAAGVCAAQETVVVLGGPQLARVVPPGFYFEGQSAPTQARNSAAARLGEKRHVIAGLVDTSGYSADVRAKDERFFITDSPINVGDAQLGVGAYGFGVTDEGKFNVFDVGGREVLSVWATADRGLRRPRPLMLSHTRGELRLYSGRSYVVLAAR